MNKLGVALWMILALPVCARDSGPRIFSPDPVFDFGARDETAVVEHTFELRNTGTEPLDIRHVRATCGCTATQLRQRRLAPGESVPLEVTVTLRGRRGRQNFSVYIHTNDPQNRQYKLELRGSVSREVDVSPPFISFGQISGDETLTHDLRLVSSLKTPLQITGIRTNPAAFFRVGQWYAAVPGREFVFPVELVADGLDQGRTYSEVFAILTDHPQHASISVPVTVHVEREVSLVPSQLLLPESQLSPQKGLVRFFMVRSPESKPCRLLSVTPPGEIQAETENLSPGRYRVRLSNILASETLATAFISVTVERHDGEEQKLALPIRVLPKR